MRSWQKKLTVAIVCAVATIAVVSYKFTNGKLMQSDASSLRADGRIDYWKEIFLKSREQSLANIDILTKTLKFMLHEVAEDDPELINFVASIIHPPSSRPYNLNSTRKNNDFSQIGQSPFMDKLLKSKRNGFFIEAGGYDGEVFSNSLFFEMERSWSGLLIEPLPSLFATLLSKHRKCHAINACIAQDKPKIYKFRVFDALSGIESAMDSRHKQRIKSESKNSKPITIFVPCFSLNTIMQAMKVKRVDYFSLDVEGAELEILKNIKLDAIDVQAFTIEHNGDTDKWKSIEKYLADKGYVTAKRDGQDIYLMKKSSPN